MIEIIFALAIGVVAGYAICSFATWNRLYRQESSIRSLSTDISVMVDMGDPVPTEWVVSKLDSLVAKEFR